MTTSNQIEHQALGYLKQSQDATLTLVKAISENWVSVLRQAGGVGAEIDALPRPAEIVDRMFDFSVQMLEAQRAFAHSLIDASGPAVRATEQVADLIGELGARRAARA